MKKNLLILIFSLGSFALWSQPYNPVLLKDLRTNETTWDASSNPSGFIKAGDRILFNAYDLGILAAPHIFATDGTEAGTIQAAGDDFSIGSYFTHGNNVVSLPSILATELVYFDGTPGNEVTIMSNLTSVFTAFIMPEHSFEVNGKAFFWASTSDNEYGIELYGTDGTADGTFLLKDINTSGDAFPGGTYNVCITVGSFAYFIANDGTNASIYKTDGTTEGTVLIETLSAPSFFNIDPVITNGQIMIFSVSNFWSLNTSNDQLTLIDEGVFPYLQHWQINDQLLVKVQHGASHEMILTDGITTTTVLENAEDFLSSNYSTEQESINGYVYLLKSENILYNAIELWKTDGYSFEKVVDSLVLAGQNTWFAVDNKLLFYNELDISMAEEHSYKLFEIDLETFDITQAFDFYALPPTTYPFLDEENGRFYFSYMDETAYAEPHYIDLGISSSSEPIENTYDLSFSVYPNPASGYINIDYKGEYDLDIYSIDGRKVYHKNKLNNFQKIDLPDLQPGLYIINAFNKTAIKTKRIIIR